MKIETVETFSNRFVGFVRVTTDDGTQGWGVTIKQDWLDRANYQVGEMGN